MDWFSWLSKPGLDPSAVYEYGLAFSNNELEESDVAYFDHEFLQSMGISVAKHRLEILKLARKYRKGCPMSFSAVPVSRLLVAVWGMKRKLGEYIRGWTGREAEPSATVVIRTNVGGYYGGPWRRGGSASNKLKRNRTVNVRGRLLLTDGSESAAEPVVLTVRKEGKFEEEEYWAAAGVEEVRWDALFQNLKPT
ncbi:hypothetical protein MLD38_021394 [Melastoma candidum]|uniref:Uncharacterized protein n=2 Tax=Melastoma candidum TaxID=119954 RepID=A0ACB9QH58_9MYRT|nr:hypothetical protein MLD38_021394 [Melastoma candidum]